jgi:hypothetical protein
MKWWVSIGTIICIYAVYQMTLNPLSWDSVVAISLATPFLIVGLVKLIQISVFSYKKHSLFKPEYQHTQNTHDHEYTTDVSNDEQYVRTTLRMGPECNVEFVGILFEGIGTLPVITGVYDWQWGKGKIPPYVLSYPLPKEEDPEGRWYWRYKTPEHRLKNTRITLGITFMATDHFTGHIIFGVNCKEGAKRQKLPFKVIKRAV